MTKTVLALALLVAAPCVPRMCAQESIAVTVPVISPQDVRRAFDDIYATPPSVTLVASSPQAHNGKVWLRSSPDGLHVWGRVEADEQGFSWPRQKSEMLSGDHVEVWLATTPQVPMPPFGWGNQFGPTFLQTRDDCADERDPHTGDQVLGAKNCERWYDEQVQYRRYLRRLFVRQWLFAGSGYSGQSHLFEDFASTAYAGLAANFFPDDLPEQLKPKPDDSVTAEFGTDTRKESKHDAAGRPYDYYHQTDYRFHLFIPYEAFPPAWQLQLTDLYLTVDVFSSAPTGRKMGEISSSAPGHRWGEPGTFNHLRISSPRSFSVSPCEYPLEQKDLYSHSHPAWFFPAKDSVLHSTFALINPAGSYMYAPAGISPEASSAQYFWKQLSTGATVCGPSLAVRTGLSIIRSEFVLDEQRLDALPLPDGWTLLRSGPTASKLSAFGSGACGSCTVLSFDIFAVSPHGESTRSLALSESLTGYGGQPSEVDLTIAPDGKQIILFRAIPDPDQPDSSPWSSVTYCLENHAYKQCGESPVAEPPNPPHFPEFRHQ